MLIEQVQETGQAMEFKVGNRVFDGIIFDAGTKHHILYFPDWAGCTTGYAKRKAAWLAKRLKSKVLLTDLYGAGRQPHNYTHQVESFIHSTLADTKALRQELTKFAEVCASLMGTQLNGLSAVGVCFGGSLAFELGRAACGLRSSVSIHGTPSSYQPLRCFDDETRFLMVHGGSDPHIPMSRINEYSREMTASKIDWRLLVLGNAVHSFTVEEIGSLGHSSRFDAKANSRAFEYSARFIEEW
ncbi:dienelactone hydrolase family protein [Thalassomonas haliotis]|uniref:Dienelactone hydrolase family protein n=1 Tax=Thalassomonas haliotis TaxID=485448 RepID=A0ABY7VDE1_9GAMM|nr:dienelactone hydrolase family protein [Thalassomonas haliotis]WDE11563.1 dienelactone hydrolase family protein [Thalassomonas haliotis]